VKSKEVQKTLLRRALTSWGSENGVVVQGRLRCDRSRSIGQAFVRQKNKEGGRTGRAIVKKVILQHN